MTVSFTETCEPIGLNPVVCPAIEGHAVMTSFRRYTEQVRDTIHLRSEGDRAVTQT
jgi:hypothetical protein